MMRTTRAAGEIPGAIWLLFCIVGTAYHAPTPNIRGKMRRKARFDRRRRRPALAVEPRNVRKTRPVRERPGDRGDRSGRPPVLGHADIYRQWRKHSGADDRRTDR